MKDPFVSVCMITYNHETYIKKAIEHVLMQSTTFPFELIIGEDCSTDKTRSIVREYEKKYPDIIVAQYPIKNRGMMKNFETVLRAASGKYIALCEGDDYWTDTLKLQKQVDILNKNASFSACAHQTTVIYDNYPNKTHLFNIIDKKIINMRDLLDVRLFHTASFMFRSDILRNLPSFPQGLYAGDRFLFLLCSLNGNIYFLNENMCCYRKNSDGITSRIRYEQHVMDLAVPEYLYKQDKRFPYFRYKSFIHRAIFSESFDTPFLSYIKHFLLFFLFSFSYFPRNLIDIYKAIYVTFWWLSKGKKYRLENKQNKK